MSKKREKGKKIEKFFVHNSYDAHPQGGDHLNVHVQWMGTDKYLL